MCIVSKNIFSNHLRLLSEIDYILLIKINHIIIYHRVFKTHKYQHNMLKTYFRIIG